MSESKMVPREPTDVARHSLAMLAALQRLVAVDDAHATLHATDGDDVARMIEYAEAFDQARAIVREVLNGGGAMCSAGPVNITGVATGSRNGLATEGDPPSPYPIWKERDIATRVSVIADEEGDKAVEQIMRDAADTIERLIAERDGAHADFERATELLNVARAERDEQVRQRRQADRENNSLWVEGYALRAENEALREDAAS